MLYLKKIIKSLKLDKNIVFVGAINNVPSFLNDMDILVVPSRSEGLGLTVLEGMAARVPVIGTNINSIKSLIKNDEYGDLFTYDDYHDLSQKIIYRVKHKDESKIDKAYDFVRRRYDIETANQRLRRVYLL